MKKILAITALAIAGTMTVNAETGASVGTQVQVKGAPVQAQGQGKMNLKAKAVEMIKANNPGMGEEGMPAMPTTGDAVTDAQLKALVTEMETKVKAIRDEYQAKIKVIIEARIQAAGTSTRPMMPKNGGDQQRGGAEGQAGMNANATNTNGGVPPMPRMRIDGQVKGDFTASQSQPQGGGVIKFLRGLFGGN